MKDVRLLLPSYQIKERLYGKISQVSLRLPQPLLSGSLVKHEQTMQCSHLYKSAKYIWKNGWWNILQVSVKTTVTTYYVACKEIWAHSRRVSTISLLKFYHTKTRTWVFQRYNSTTFFFNPLSLSWICILLLFHWHEISFPQSTQISTLMPILILFAAMKTWLTQCPSCRHMPSIIFFLLLPLLSLVPTPSSLHTTRISLTHTSS